MANNASILSYFLHRNLSIGFFWRIFKFSTLAALNFTFPLITIPVIFMALYCMSTLTSWLCSFLWHFCLKYPRNSFRGRNLPFHLHFLLSLYTQPWVLILLRMSIVFLHPKKTTYKHQSPNHKKGIR